jgi:glycosyltransferase involved in cell wall biosynthesis
MSRPVSLVTELYPPNLGGQESRFSQFAEAMAARGRDVTVYTTDHTGGSLPREERSHGVRVVRYVALRGYVRNGSRGLSPLYRYWRETRRLLAELLATGDPVWVNEMPVVHLLGTPDATGLVVDWCEFPTYWKVNAFARRLGRRIRRSTANSRAIADRVRSLGRDPRVDVVRIMVAPSPDPTPAKEPGTIAYVGRIVAHKNLGALAEAVRLFNGNGGPHARLLIAGDGPERPALERRYGRNGQIQFLGVVSDAEKRHLLESSWMVAVPGSREGLPTCAVEATVYGTPLLASGSPLNSTGAFIRSNGLGVVARGTRPVDFLEALRSIDDPTWGRWHDRTTELKSLWDPAENVRRLEAALDRSPS